MNACERLERQVRWLRRAVLVLAFMVAAGFLLAAAGEPATDLSVRSLTVMQPNGRPGLLIKATDDGGGIFIYGASRKDGPMISIFSIPQENGGGAQIFMHNARGERAVNIVAQKKGNVHTW